MSSLPGANIAKHLLPLTPEEQSLLDLYNEVRAFEKLAAQARSDASKAVLVAADEEYQKKAGRDIGTGLNGNIEQDGDNSITQLNKDGVKNSKKSQNKKKKSEAKKVKHMAENDTADVSGDESDNESDGESNLIQAEKERLRQMKLEQLRGDVEEGLKEEQKNEEEIQQLEQRRNEFLRQSSSTADSSITIQRKNKRNFDNMNQSEEQEPSLLANINHMTTPPHDFSKSLKMNRVTGKQLFPEIVTPSSISTWSPPEDANAPDEGCLELELPGFDPAEAADGRGNNTLAIKFTAPRDSRRFSINLATPDHANYYSVLFHFNPRQFEKGGQVVLNDKQSGIWGQGIDVPLSTFPLMFGEVSCTIIIQIHGDGFDVFMDGRHCARLEHRAPLPQKSGPLILQFPSTDDYGNPENWSVYKVWWGNKDIMASEDISHVPGVNLHSSLYDTKLFVSGLPKISTEAQIDLRRAELERAFRKYGGALGVTVTCPPNCSFAFVEVESYRAADMAIREMGNKYNINRARKSRYEALMEQRAAAGDKHSVDDSGWA